ncbi:MAG: LPS export ABC transporter periplasmic protein LptC [Acidiferrobacterales bacterium]
MPSKKKLRHILPTLLITVTGAFGWWLSDLLSVKNLVVKEETGPIPLFSMKNMTASFIDDNGKKKYTLMAKIMHRYSGERGTTLKNLHLIQHKTGRADLHTTADRGFLSEDQKLLKMRGNVKISSKKNIDSPAGTINTDTLEVRLD